MATDATGTPTPLGIPKLDVSNDAPSGLGFNAAMDEIDALFQTALLSGSIANIAVGTVPVWDGTAWVKPSGTPDGTKFLRDDGVWALAGGSAPTGVVLPYSGATAPSSAWLLADGAAVSRSTYSALFALFSTTYGTGDGSTTFNVPDLRGRVAVGKGSNATVNALGNSDGVAEANRRPKHRHTPHTHAAPWLSNGAQAGGGSNAGGPGTGPSVASADGGSGVSTDSLDAPAYIVLNYIIKT